jgi:hypothetical protein
MASVEAAMMVVSGVVRMWMNRRMDRLLRVLVAAGVGPAPRRACEQRETWG